MKKEDETRERFKSRFQNGFLIEIDLSGFHLYLLHLILKKPFPENVYEEFGKLYFKKNSLTQEEVEQSKTTTFQNIYGGISKDLLQIPFFAKVHDLIKNLWVQYKTDSLKTFLFDRPIKSKNLPELSQNKVFNYMLQNLETEFNSTLIERFLDYLKDKETKLVRKNIDNSTLHFYWWTYLLQFLLVLSASTNIWRTSCTCGILNSFSFK